MQPLERQVLVTFRAAKARGPISAGYGRPGRGGRASPTQAKAERMAGELGLQLRDGWPMPSLGVDCYVMQLSPSQDRGQVLGMLEQDDRVESAQAMQEFRVLGSGDPLLSTQPVARPWHLRELHAAATGRNVTIAEVDTGVLATHPDLRGRLEQSRNFVPGQDFVAESHGTAVASILGAQADDGIGIAGVAPGARVLALRACWQVAENEARCSSYSLAQALQYALVAHVRVINLSLTGPTDALLGRLLDVAAREHVVTIAAVDATRAGGGFPASHPGVLAVAAQGDPERLPEAVQAPGRGIPAAQADGGWALVSGASFAAAQVSGLAALLLELSPRLETPALRRMLVPRDGDRVVDACAAFAAAGRRGCATLNAPAGRTRSVR